MRTRRAEQICALLAVVAPRCIISESRHEVHLVYAMVTILSTPTCLPSFFVESSTTMISFLSSVEVDQLFISTTRLILGSNDPPSPPCVHPYSITVEIIRIVFLAIWVRCRWQGGTTPGQMLVLRNGDADPTSGAAIVPPG